MTGKRAHLAGSGALPSFRKLEGYRVSTDPKGRSIELLIRGFANEGELETFVMKLRAMGLLSLEMNGTSDVIDAEET